MHGANFGQEEREKVQGQSGRGAPNLINNNFEVKISEHE